MAETETADTINTTVPPPESEGSTTLPTMSDNTSEQTSKDADLKKESSEEKKLGGFSLRIWPPTQKTRDAVSNRLIETLSTESILTKRYGTINSEEATAIAKSIEEEAYGVASKESNEDDGIKVLEIYSKEISKRMLEMVKTRSTTTAGNGTESANESVEDTKPDAEAPESVKTED